MKVVLWSWWTCEGFTCEVYACICYCVLFKHNPKCSIVLLKIMHRLQLCENIVFFLLCYFRFLTHCSFFCCMMDFGLGCYKFRDDKWRITHNSSLLVVEGGVGFETMNELVSLKRETSEEILPAKAQVQQHQQWGVNQML